MADVVADSPTSPTPAAPARPARARFCAVRFRQARPQVPSNDGPPAAAGLMLGVALGALSWGGIIAAVLALW